VYRVDVPGKEEAVFGVAIAKGKGADKYIMDYIDFGDVKIDGPSSLRGPGLGEQGVSPLCPLPHRHQLPGPQHDGSKQLHVHHERAGAIKESLTETVTPVSEKK